MIPSPALGGRQRGRSTCLPSAHARLIISSVEISFRTAIYMATVRASRHSGRARTRRWTAAEWRSHSAGSRALRARISLERKTFLSVAARPEGVPVAEGEVGGRDMAHLCQT
mgnify:FL=1